MTDCDRAPCNKLLIQKKRSRDVLNTLILLETGISTIDSQTRSLIDSSTTSELPTFFPRREFDTSDE